MNVQIDLVTALIAAAVQTASVIFVIVKGSNKLESRLTRLETQTGILLERRHYPRAET